MDTVTDELHVLLVEDNPNDATLIERHLGDANSSLLPSEVTVDHHETLATAVDALDDHEAHIVLLDLGLEETTGMETYDRIEPHVEETAVVVLTNLDDEQAAVDALQRGAQDFINKGNLDRQRLVNALRYALERREREAELETKNAQLEVLNRMVRHDIRNDVMVLQAWAEEVQSRLDGQDSEDLQRVLDAADHIRDLTETAREYIELITGRPDVETHPVAVRSVLQEELDRRRSAYPEARFAVVGEVPDVDVRANEMLSTVFRNLLNNAVQHNDRATPQVEIEVTETADRVRVDVADDGPGIPDDQKDVIFGRGEQGLDSSGTGIGLYLVATLLDGYGGDVAVTDNEPRGAVFTVTLRKA